MAVFHSAPQGDGVGWVWGIFPLLTTGDRLRARGGLYWTTFLIGDISVEYHDGSLLMLRFSQGSNWHFLMSLGWQERKRKNIMGFKW